MPVKKIVFSRWNGRISGRLPGVKCPLSYPEYLAHQATCEKIEGELAAHKTPSPESLARYEAAMQAQARFLHWMFREEEHPVSLTKALHFERAAKKAGRIGRLRYRG